MDKISIKRVVDSGICVGCGACSIVTYGAIKIEKNNLGFYQANLDSVSTENLETGSKVCPFSDECINEDQIAQEVFPEIQQQDTRIGRSLSTYAAQVRNGENINLSSSGGLTSWLTLKLLDLGLVDGIIHVASSEASKDGSLFCYTVSTTKEEIRSRRKSQYYSTTLNAVFSEIRGNEKNYAIVGVPCFIKAARLIAREDLVLKSQLLFFIGLVCGHLKSSGFAELLAWQVGVPPPVLSSVDFRIKISGKSAGDYNFGAKKAEDIEYTSKPTRSLLGGNWGHAMFQLKACDYCDDIFAETADVAFGDAWLPQYSNDWRGTNVLVCRNTKIQSILTEGFAAGELMLEPLSVDMLAESQNGNYRHRWEGLSLRLADDILEDKWTPRKRIKPGSRKISKTRKEIIRIRRAIAHHSHITFEKAKQKNSLDYFMGEINPFVKKMQNAYLRSEASLTKRIIQKIKSKISLLIIKKNN